MLSFRDLGYKLSGFYGAADRSPNKDVFKSVSGRSSGGSGVFRVSFLPSFAYDNFFGRVVSGDAHNVVYRLPKNVISKGGFRVSEVLDVLEEYFVDASAEVINSEGFVRKEVFGASFGSVLACRLANSVGVDGLELLVPGASISRCVRDGFFTGGIYELSVSKGLVDPQTFYDDFRVWDPENNVFGLPVGPDNLRVHLGFLDRVTPFVEGMNLVGALRDFGKDPKVNIGWLSGHSDMIARFRGKKVL